MATIHLIGVGKVLAEPACNLVVGDRIMWNYGSVYTVVGIEDVSPKFLAITERDKDGKVWPGLQVQEGPPAGAHGQGGGEAARAGLGLHARDPAGRRRGLPRHARPDRGSGARLPRRLRPPAGVGAWAEPTSVSLR